MKKQSKIASFLSVLSLTGVAVSLPIQPSHAQVPVRFFCGQSQGVPATMVERVNKSKPPAVIVRWTSDYFTDSGFSPAKRCAMVSEKFQEAYAKNPNFLFTTSISNGHPIVCSAEVKGGACATMLYTLKKGKQDPILTMLRLEKVRSGASGPLNESSAGVSEQPYVGVQSLITQVLDEQTAPDATVMQSTPEIAEPSAVPAPTVQTKPLSLW